MAIWDIGRSPFSGDTQEEVGSKDPTLWEAGKEPQVMGAEPRRMAPPPLPTHPNAPCAYSPQCVESKFCELLRIDGVLRSSAVIQNQDVRKGPSQLRSFCLFYASVCISERLWPH